MSAGVPQYCKKPRPTNVRFNMVDAKENDSIALVNENPGPITPLLHYSNIPSSGGFL